MQNDKQHVLSSAIDCLKARNYADGQPACLALVISRHYRLLAESCAENHQQINYINQSSAWFSGYLKNRA